MSATREHRNAARIDDAVAKIAEAIAETNRLLDTLAAYLPDDYPFQDVTDALEMVDEARKRLTEVAS